MFKYIRVDPPAYTGQGVIFITASHTGGAGGRKEGGREGEGEEKGGGAKLPAPGEPGQSDAGSAQGSHHA